MSRLSSDDKETINRMLPRHGTGTIRSEDGVKKFRLITNPNARARSEGWLEARGMKRLWRKATGEIRLVKGEKEESQPIFDLEFWSRWPHFSGGPSID